MFRFLVVAVFCANIVSGVNLYHLDSHQEAPVLKSVDGLSSSQSEVIELSNGMKIQGLEYAGGLNTFKGIPFAQSPVGANRFLPPKELEKTSSDEVKNCEDYANYCLQKSGGDEDCLFLNVFANLKVARENKKVPVAIFVHGGSYNSGSSNLYSGSSNVNYWKGEGILVTVNYRLNVFGFLGSDQLRENGDGTVGMWGIQDQRMAFKWVKENIDRFGGDPDRVMIFGESAGAGSMSNHLTNKLSWPYFNSVALESGSLPMWAMQPMSLAEEKYSLVLEATGCTNADCLRNMPAADLYEKTASLSSTSPVGNAGYTFWTPTCDGIEATEHPWFSAAKGVIHDVPILHGTNTDEGAMFTALDQNSATENQLKLMWGAADYLDNDKMESLYVTDKQYPTDTGYSFYWYAGERSIGDLVFSCPDKYAANIISKHLKEGTLQNAKSYVYHFEHISEFQPPQMQVVDHASELPYTFHMTYLMQDNSTDVPVADLMSTYWGNFLLSGDPNHQQSFGVQLDKEGIAPWAPYSFDQINVHAVEDGTASGVRNLESYKTDECDYLIPIIENNIKESFAS